MLKSVEGVYSNGKIDLMEEPGNVCNGTHVIVTFLVSGPIDLQSRGLNEAQAADLRARLQTFAEDWESSEMDIYDDYDAAKAKFLKPTRKPIDGSHAMTRSSKIMRKYS